jgi:adenylate kinase family enzyme
MKLHIFGASGTGVTTLGQALSATLNIPYFDSDQYYWEKSDPPFTARRNPAERDALLRNDLHQQDNWIVGGSVIHWNEDVFPPFDLIIFLWLPPAIRMDRLWQRELERYGDIILTDPQRKEQTNTFMAWAADYDHDTGIATRTLQAHEQWLKGQTAPILELRGDMTVSERVMRTMERLT